MGKKIFDWITVVPFDSHGGGSESQQINLFQHLQKEGYECLVICLSKKDMNCWTFLEENGKVIYFPVPRRYLKISFLWLLPTLIYLFVRYHFRYTFSTQSLINSVFGILKRIGLASRTKVIVRESNSIFQLFTGLKKKRYSLGYKLGYPYVDLVICQTKLMKENLLNAVPWMKDRLNIQVIHNPINLDQIKEKEKEVIPGLYNNNYIVAAGTLTDKKGFDILINSFHRIHHNYPDHVLFILGRGSNKSKLQNQIKALGLEDRIFLKGFVHNVYPYFKNAEMCVISSRIEGFPNVLLQMMSQNTKIVCTLSAGGIDKVPGIFTCKPNDEQELAKSMSDCLSSDLPNNREIFDDYLKKRNTKSFVTEILSNL